jgi:hypothetical protein
MRYLILILFLYSCSAQSRLNRLIEKHPDLVQNDTIKDTTRIITEKVMVDTFLSLNNMVDTVYLEKDKLKIKTVFLNNEIFIQGECESDTIIVTKEIPVERLNYIPDTPWTDFKKFIKTWWKWLLGITLIIVVYRITRKFV